jgi:hypothetical protein
VNALIHYLLDNLILDFQGDMTMDTIRGWLRDDDSRDARELLRKLTEDRGTESMMITLADCLKEYLSTGISAETVREQLRTYIES